MPKIMSAVDTTAKPVITVIGTPVKGACLPEIKNMELNIPNIFCMSYDFVSEIYVVILQYICKNCIKVIQNQVVKD